MLFIVPTPIGNLQDITLRAIETLKTVDKIAAEDTRRAKILLGKFEIKTPLLSFHAHSSDRKVEELIELMKSGEKLALISEAGTPGISDPGYPLIRRTIEEEILVEVLPGASAFLVGLVASGLPSHNFLYLGFLPKKKGRQTLLKSLAEEERTMVLYEAPFRIEKSLEEFVEIFGGKRPACIARELTKMHEEVLRGTLKELLEHFKTHKPRGEFTLVIGGKTAPPYKS